MLCALNVCMGGHPAVNYQCAYYYYISKTLQQFENVILTKYNSAV